MAADRENKLRAIKAGDIFRAKAPNGAILVCKALAISKNSIEAERMFMQGEIHQFDRTTGLEQGHKNPATIDSVAPLPDNIRDVLKNLDHRERTSTDPKGAKLSEPEQQALLFIYDHYRDNQI